MNVNLALKNMSSIHFFFRLILYYNNILLYITDTVTESVSVTEAYMGYMELL